MEKLRVYFLGAGAIAVPVLEALSACPAIDLVGTGTQVDRPAGRHRRLTPTPVGEWAAAHHHPIDKIPSVNAPEFIAHLKALRPDIILVISFGQLLKKEILYLDGAVCVNIHASLLPRYRGASPIAAAIIDQEEVTGITFMKMAEGLDTGAIYRRYEYRLDGTENAMRLEHILGRLAAHRTPEVLAEIAAGTLPAMPQCPTAAKLTHKLHKEHGLIDWHKTAGEIDAMVRGYYPWPGACFHLEHGGRNLTLRLTAAGVVPEMTGRPGEVLRADKRQWIVACGDGALELSQVVPEGKKEMSGADFLRGCRIAVGTIL
ncbi:MAG: methionyl-tRNA formyltransferase [Victivallales bacterium]|nr:methionyl-tRNA formyltransferase [Victivallales bacterium]